MLARALALTALALCAGCLAGEPVNPNIAAPKLLVQPREDGNVTLFVHSAFGERAYDWIALSIDNASVANRTDAFSLEEQVASLGFYAEVEAGANDQVYLARVRVDVVPEDERALVSFLDEQGKWSDPRPYALPFGTILERRGPA